MELASLISLSSIFTGREFECLLVEKQKNILFSYIRKHVQNYFCVTCIIMIPVFSTIKLCARNMCSPHISLSAFVNLHFVK